MNHSRRTIAMSLGVLLCGSSMTSLAAGQGLSQEERVACHRSVEEVRWSHRIWPESNPDPKPPLPAVLGDEALQRMAEDSAGMSAVLAEFYGREITQDILQAELNRMAKQTQAPEQLDALWAALDHDPRLIAECLVRPVLARREMYNAYAGDDRIHGQQRAEIEANLLGLKDVDELPAEDVTTLVYRPARSTGDSTEQRQPESRKRSAGVTPSEIVLDHSEWLDLRSDLGLNDGPTASRAPGVAPGPKVGAGPDRTALNLEESDSAFYVRQVVRAEHDRLVVASASWPKRPFGDWWNETRSDLDWSAHEHQPVVGLKLPEIVDHSQTPRGAGGEHWYSPASPPEGRYLHTAVWTGSEMIVWGGYDGSSTLATGGRYDPATDSWAPTATANAPIGRYLHTAVWTGNEMIVWGGASPTLERSGGRYDPVEDSWIATSNVSSPEERYYHTAIWTGSEMIVWGGLVGDGFGLLVDTDTGSRYDPVSDNWAETTTSSAPSARDRHTATWIDNEMAVWGGREFDDEFDSSLSLDSGATYDPDTDTWVGLTTNGSPDARYDHTAVWTGSELLVWGGMDIATDAPGGRFDPDENSWSPISTAGAPGNWSTHTAVWTGSEMVVWGSGSAGGRYRPATDSWESTIHHVTLGERVWHTAVWTGSEMIVWGGAKNGDSLSTGGRYNPNSDSWMLTATNAPSRRYDHTVVWTGNEMLVWGGYDDNNYLNTGGRYEPATDTWSATTTLDAPDGRSLHKAVWTGSEMIVWGGKGEEGSLDTGGRYDPIVDDWAATATTGAPAGRSGHSMVWSGSEMIVWGGLGPGYTSSGSRYSPVSNSWTATSLSGAPGGRRDHTAVWTGTEMIIWGGFTASPGTYLDSGGRYNPATDTWVSTNGSSPAARAGHTAVWAGEGMIVWGGGNLGGRLNSGGRYDPTSDSWLAVDLAGAPEARANHTAVWTGDEMVIWGGTDEFGPISTGGRYDPVAGIWAPLSTTNAPEARSAHGAVWTGEAMIVSHGEGAGSNPRMDYGVYTIIPPPDELFRDRFEQ